MRFYTKQKRPPAINIVSLIDTLCVLLIFFIVTTTFKKNEPTLQIRVPDSTQGTKEQRPQEPVIIYATKTQKIYVGTEEVPLDRLAVILKNKKSQGPSSVFALKADTDIPLGFFVKVLDAAKEAGLNDISMFTEEPKKATP